MAQQLIGLGAAPNDNTGDTPRVAGGKINDNFTELYAQLLASNSVDTSGSTITFNLASRGQNIFVGSASFATAKTIALSNTTGALVFQFIFEVTNVAATLTFLGAFEAQTSDTRWNAGTNIWTPGAIGKYELSALNDGTNWKLVISQPYA